MEFVFQERANIMKRRRQTPKSIKTGFHPDPGVSKRDPNTTAKNKKINPAPIPARIIQSQSII